MVAIFGDKVVALSMGVIYTMFLAMFHKKSVRKSNTDSTGKDPESFREVVLNSWVARGLEVELAALLITGMGGGFSQVIKSFPNINDLATLIQNSGVPGPVSYTHLDVYKRQAPIFEIADYGICGDLFKVTPMLIEAIKAAKAAK